MFSLSRLCVFCFQIKFHFRVVEHPIAFYFIFIFFTNFKSAAMFVFWFFCQQWLPPQRPCVNSSFGQCFTYLWMCQGKKTVWNPFYPHWASLHTSFQEESIRKSSLRAEKLMTGVYFYGAGTLPNTSDHFALTGLEISWLLALRAVISLWVHTIIALSILRLIENIQIYVWLVSV